MDTIPATDEDKSTLKTTDNRDLCNRITQLLLHLSVSGAFEYHKWQNVYFPRTKIATTVAFLPC
jgi:hypothetical protein